MPQPLRRWTSLGAVLQRCVASQWCVLFREDGMLALLVADPVTACLRACLKRSRSRRETLRHQLNHGDSDPRLGGFRQRLKVFTQPPRAIEPAERAFHDPSPLHYMKALGVPRAFHDHEGPLQHRRDPCDKLTGVAAIGPEQL